MGEDLSQLQTCLQLYITGQDSTRMAGADTSALLDRIESGLRGREPATPVAVAVLLAQGHLARYQILPAGEDGPSLEAAIRWYRRILATHPELVPVEVRELIENGSFGPADPEFGDPDLLPDAALEAAVNQLDALAAGGDCRWQANLAAFLATSWERHGDLDHLNRAIALGRAVLDPRSGDHPARIAARTNLAGALVSWSVRFSDRDALQEAIGLYGEAVADRGSPADHANFAVAQLNLYEMAGEMTALQSAVDHARTAVILTPDADPSYPSRVSNLAGAVRALYDETGRDDDLNDALAMAELAVRVSSPEDPALARRLSNLSAVLSTRFETTGDLKDITRAIQTARSSCSTGLHDGAPGRVSNLMLALHLRGAATGDLLDLQEALRLGRATAADLPVDHADRADILSNAAGAAMSWFDWTGDIDAITQAVELSREAVVGEGLSSRDGLLLTNLSMHLLTRFEATGHRQDVGEAIRHAQRAIALVRGPARFIALSNLSVSLRTRFEFSGSPADLTDALAAARAALTAVPAGHRDTPSLASNLALCLWASGLQQEALEQASVAARHPMTEGTASGAAFAANLARMLAEAGVGQEEVGQWWATVTRDPAAPVHLRIEAHLGRAMMPDLTPTQAAGDLAAAVQLLPMAAWHGVGIPSRIRRLQQWQGIGSDAAATTLSHSGAAPALVLLDTALSHLWARETLTSNREDDLRRAHPDLAARVERLREALARGG